MKERLKPIFISKKSEHIEILYLQLSNFFGNIFIKDEYLDKRILSIKANNKDFILSLIIGNLIVKHNNLDVMFIDINGIPKKIDYFCIFKLFVKPEYENYEKILQNLREFVTLLSKRSDLLIDLEYVCLSKKFEIYLNISEIFDEVFCRENKNDNKNIINEMWIKYKKLLKKLASFFTEYLELKQDKNIFEIEFLGMLGTVLKSNYIISTKRVRNFEKYFTLSSLYLGLNLPTSRNIAPKCDINKIDGVSKKIFEEVKISNTNLKIGDVHKSGIELMFKGITSFRQLYYLNYVDESMIEFEMQDIFNISSKIQIVDKTQLIVTSKLKLNRYTNGNMPNNVTPYDFLFYGLEHKDSKFTFEVKDYYEIIDLNLLLHYSDISKFYEVYEIPIGFKFENGLSELKNQSVLYDFYNPEWIEYEHIKEVKTYLLSKKHQ